MRHVDCIRVSAKLPSSISETHSFKVRPALFFMRKFFLNASIVLTVLASALPVYLLLSLPPLWIAHDSIGVRTSLRIIDPSLRDGDNQSAKRGFWELRFGGRPRHAA